MITNHKRMGYDEMAMRDFQMRNSALKKLFVTQFQGVQRKIPELMFKTYFLDWFAGKVKDVDGALRVQWLNIAGSMYDPVMIVDANGKDIRRVPPLCDRDVVAVTMRKTDNKEETVGSMFEHATNAATLSANMANSQLASKLTNNYLPHEVVSAQSELVNEWRELLAYYGVGKSSEAQNTQPSAAADDSALEFEFE